MSLIPTVDYWVLGISTVAQIAIVCGIIYAVRRYLKSRKSRAKTQGDT